MHRYFIELAYNGNGYNGWQIQPNAPSVQEDINKALSLLLKQDINVTGAGRTDTGVNASFFVAHFDSNAPVTDTQALTDKLNRFLGKHISIKEIYPVLPEAHARFSALSRTYKYYINKTKNPLRGLHQLLEVAHGRKDQYLPDHGSRVGRNRRATRLHDQG